MVANNQRVFSRVLGGRSKKLAPAIADEVLTWQFSNADRERVADLLDRNNANALSRKEMEELDTLVVLGTLLDILHAKARLALNSKRPQQAA